MSDKRGLGAHRQRLRDEVELSKLCSVGAVDGKHVVIKSPAKSGSMYFNYKGTFSVVVLAVIDANYSFVIIDVGGYGKQSDGGTLATSEFGVRLNRGKLALPEAKSPSGFPTALPHVFVADEAFPLLKNMMRPYPGKKVGPAERIYNYRLSRARRIVENAFGILAARFSFSSYIGPATANG